MNQNKDNEISENISNNSQKETRSYKRKKQKGDRWDGYRVKNIPSFQKLIPYLMKTRNGSSIYFKETYDVSKVVEYLDKKNKKLKNKSHKDEDKGHHYKGNSHKDENNSLNYEDKNHTQDTIKKYNYNQFFISSLIRIIALRPHLNRFIAGKKIYQRHNIDIAYVIKKEFNDAGEESVTISTFERDSNIEDVRKILSPTIKGVKNETKDEHGDFIDTFTKLPSFIISFVVMLLNFFIVIGHCPNFLKKIDVMQCSAFVSNLGSIDLETVPFHHLYDRGTCSVFLTVGKVKKIANSNKLDNSNFNKEESGKYEVEISITFDERVTDGFYLVNSLKLLQNLFDNPEQLDERLKEVPIDE